MMLFLLASLAWAQSPPAESALSDQASQGLGPNFLLVLHDETQGLSELPLVAKLKTADEPMEFQLLDNGVPPDPRAGDHHYVVPVQGYPAGVIEVSLFSGEQLLGVKTEELDPEMAIPSLRLSWDGSALAGSFRSDLGMTTGPSSSAAAPAQISTAPAASLPVPQAAASQPEALWSYLGGGFLLGSLLALGLELRRRRAGGTARQEAPLQRSYLVPAEQRRQRTTELAQHLAQSGPVLLVLPPAETEQQPPQGSGIFQHLSPRPKVGELLRSAQAVARLGPMSLIVEGADALEKPQPEESPDAVLEELLDLWPHALYILVTEGEPCSGPALRPEEDPHWRVSSALPVDG